MILKVLFTLSLLALLYPLAGCSPGTSAPVETEPLPVLENAPEVPVTPPVSPAPAPEPEPSPVTEPLAGPGITAEIGPQVGKLAPDFGMMLDGGKKTSLSGLRGKAVMLNFWATWCGPCRSEMPLIDGLFRGGELGQDLVLLTVNSGESAEKVKDFLDKTGYAFPVLLDPDSLILRAYQVRGIPTTFFIGRDGVIGSIKIGAFTSEAELTRSIKDITEK